MKKRTSKEKDLFRREWMRGYITATGKYSIIKHDTNLKELYKEWRKYLKENPEARKDITFLPTKQR